MLSEHDKLNRASGVTDVLKSMHIWKLSNKLEIIHRSNNNS